jgi:hypothetical protein
MNTVFKTYAAIALFVACSLHGASLEDFLFTVQCDGLESGSGFLLKDTNEVWMISNCHVVRQDGEIKFIGMLDESRAYTLPETVEVAANRDAIRFKTEEPDGFALSGTSSFDETVFAFGNSDGLGVITKSEGKVVGKGRGEIEVTCEIIPGNSGGPVLNTNDAVIGIATFGVTVPGVKISAELSGTVSAAERERLVEQIKDRQGTRYTEARRFAVPLHDAGWQPVERELFKQESQRYKEIDDQYDRFNATVLTVFRCRSIPAENEDLFSRGWVRNYNRDLYEYGSYDSDSGRYYLRSGRKESFERAYGRWIQNLSETAEQLSEEFRTQADALTILYYQNETKAKADKLGVKNRELMDIAKKYGR